MSADQVANARAAGNVRCLVSPAESLPQFPGYIATWSAGPDRGRSPRAGHTRSYGASRHIR